MNSNRATWDSHDRFSMAKFIKDSGMDLEYDEVRLVRKLTDDIVYANVSAYDLYEANGLCFMALGWMRAKNKL